MAVLIQLPWTALAQTAGGEQPAPSPTDEPAATAPSAPATNAVAALDLGDCPDNAVGLAQGQTFTCACPALTDPAAVYGSEVYTQYSGICTAAVHAGALPRTTAGGVTLQVIASPPVFKGATRTGIKSEAWAQPADAAFQFTPTK